MSNEIVYQGQTYTDDHIESGSGRIFREESLAMESLGVDTLECRVSGTGVETFVRGASVVCRHKGGQIMTASCDGLEQVGPRQTRLTATSPLGLLMTRRHYGGVYTGQTAQTVIQDICGGVAVYVEPVFRSIPVYGWLPIDWARNNLIRVLFAINANLRTGEDGVIRVQNLSTAVQSVLTADRIYREGASARTQAPVTSVTVLEHQFIAQSATESDTLFEGTTVAGQVIEFSAPMFDLAASGFAITGQGANYAVVGAGNGTLTGKPYTHVTRAITRAVTPAAVENEERFEDCCLVGLTNSAAVADRLEEYFRHREIVNVDAVTTYEAPGDVVSIYHPYKRQQVNACIFHSMTVLSGVLKSSLSALVGFTPWQTVAFEDVREVLTGSGTWTPPAGVTMVTAVLIEPGRGGYPGQAGEAAQSLSERSWQSEDSAATTYYKTVDTAQSGKGGAAGQGGDGGRILRVDIPITGSISFAYVCPAGGPGGAYGGDAQGDQPSPTTFGAYSTATGARSDTGYTDPIDGTVYAAPGDVGVPGGDGVSPTSTPDPILVDGQSYAPGGQGTTVRGEEGSTSSRYGIRGYQIAGGLGGGPAYGANGEDGASGLGSIYTSSVSGTIAKGGKGADALPPPKESTYGKGGRGGNGGGGGGSTGVQTGIYNRVPKSGGASRATMTLITINLAQGGAGSAGGTGGDGVIILYYRRPVL